MPMRPLVSNMFKLFAPTRRVNADSPLRVNEITSSRDCDDDSFNNYLIAHILHSHLDRSQELDGAVSLEEVRLFSW